MHNVNNNNSVGLVCFVIGKYRIIKFGNFFLQEKPAKLCVNYYNIFIDLTSIILLKKKKICWFLSFAHVIFPLHNLIVVVKFIDEPTRPFSLSRDDVSFAFAGIFFFALFSFCDVLYVGTSSTKDDVRCDRKIYRCRHVKPNYFYRFFFFFFSVSNVREIMFSVQYSAFRRAIINKSCFTETKNHDQICRRYRCLVCRAHKTKISYYFIIVLYQRVTAVPSPTRRVVRAR